MTNQGTTTPGNRGHSATQPDTNIRWSAVTRPIAILSDETGMHGKEKAYGSIS